MDGIKKDLRSVLLSKAGGVPLKDVARDYRSLVGTILDWRSLNFKTLEQFLRSIPDVLRLEMKNGELYAFGIANNMFINPTARKAQFRGMNLTDPKQKQKDEPSSDMDVYFGNLPLDITEESLRSFLSAYPHKCIRLRKQNRCAFVETTRCVGMQMCAELNGRKVGGVVLRVESSKQDRHPKGKGSTTSSKSPSPTELDVESRSARAVQNSVPLNRNKVGQDESNDRGNLVQPRPIVDTVNQPRASSTYTENVPTVRVKVSPAVDQLRRTPSPSGSVPPEVPQPISRQLPERTPEVERPKLFWDSDDELPALVDNRLDDHEVASLMKSSARETKKPTPPSPKEPTSIPPSRAQNINPNNRPEGVQNINPNIPPSGVQNINPNTRRIHHDSCSSSVTVVDNFTWKSDQDSRKRHDGFNLYVKNIPNGTTSDELKSLFQNCIKIVPLSGYSCFVIYNTMTEVETAAEQIWTIHGSLLLVDVATRHKTTDPSIRTCDDRSLADFSSDFENITCTIGGGAERRVRRSVGFDGPKRNFDRPQERVAIPANLTRQPDNRAPSKVLQTTCQPLLALPLWTPMSSAKSSQSPAPNSATSFNKVLTEHSGFPDSSGDRRTLPDVCLSDGTDRTVSSDDPVHDPNSPSGDGVKLIPQEMRLKELVGFYRDTFPNGKNLDASDLEDSIDIIVTVVVPEFNDRFLWGQLVSEPWRSGIEEVFGLGAKMAAIESKLVQAGTNVRRGAAKYGDDWCRVWIKNRGESKSEVFFVDYGNAEIVPNESIFQLSDEFWGVRPAAVPFKIVDDSKVNIRTCINSCVTAKVKKGLLQSLVVDIFDVCIKTI